MLLSYIKYPYLLQNQSKISTNINFKTTQIKKPLTSTKTKINTLNFLHSQFPNTNNKKLKKYLKHLTTNTPNIKTHITKNKNINQFTKQYQTPTKFHNKKLKIQQNKTIPYIPSKHLHQNIKIKN